MAKSEPRAPKPYWTATKILVLVLVGLLGAGAFGFALINYQIGRTLPGSGSNTKCSNRATNYPACNNIPCTNGAINPPTCTMFSPCSNEATNPPACNVFPTCTNGATNYPQCTMLPHCRGKAACFTGSVTYIVDGDTLDVGSTRVRLGLVNTPEVGQAGYQEAKDFTAQTCPVGTQALVDEDDGQTAGSYGRVIALVYCGEKNLNEGLLRSGYAELVTYYCSVSEFADEAWTGCS